MGFDIKTTLIPRNRLLNLKMLIIGVITALALVTLYIIYNDSSSQMMILNLSSDFINDCNALSNSAVVTYTIHIDNSFNLPISGTG
jgi:hypothetical protein